MCRFSRRDNMERKNIRLRDFDYSSNNMYFVTICTKDKKNLFWKSYNIENGDYVLSEEGKVVEKGIINIKDFYPVSVQNYVVMPNHVHIVMTIEKEDFYNKNCNLSNIIKQYKGFVSKQIKFSPWQKSFYEHIVRNEKEYLKIYEYISTNPLKWNLDNYYKEMANWRLS